MTEVKTYVQFRLVPENDYILLKQGMQMKETIEKTQNNMNSAEYLNSALSSSLISNLLRQSDSIENANKVSNQPATPMKEENSSSTPIENEQKANSQELQVLPNSIKEEERVEDQTGSGKRRGYNHQ